MCPPPLCAGRENSWRFMRAAPYRISSGSTTSVRGRQQLVTIGKQCFCGLPTRRSPNGRGCSSRATGLPLSALCLCAGIGRGGIGAPRTGSTDDLSVRVLILQTGLATTGQNDVGRRSNSRASTPGSRPELRHNNPPSMGSLAELKDLVGVVANASNGTRSLGRLPTLRR